MGEKFAEGARQQTCYCIMGVVEGVGEEGEGGGDEDVGVVRSEEGGDEDVEGSERAVYITV